MINETTEGVVTEEDIAAVERTLGFATRAVLSTYEMVTLLNNQVADAEADYEDAVKVHEMVAADLEILLAGEV